jgi:uncharacterized protein YeaC (DUF1315 family)
LKIPFRQLKAQLPLPATDLWPEGVHSPHTRTNTTGTLQSLLASQSRSSLGYQFGARGFGGRHALTMSSQQLKEVIQVTHTNVDSVASLGALVGGEVHR